MVRIEMLKELTSKLELCTHSLDLVSSVLYNYLLHKGNTENLQLRHLSIVKF